MTLYIDLSDQNQKKKLFQSVLQYMSPTKGRKVDVNGAFVERKSKFRMNFVHNK